MVPEVIKRYLLPRLIYYIKIFDSWHHIDDAVCIITSNEQGWKNYVFWYTKPVSLKPSLERCAPRNFVLLVTLGGTWVRLIVYLAVYQMK